MEKYLKKAMGIIWSPLFIFPFIFILMQNYIAFVELDSLAIETRFIVLKSEFVKFALICIDCLIIYTFYSYLKIKFKKKKVVTTKNDESHLLKWTEKLKKNNEFENIRFKKLNVVYPLFVFPQNLLDEVNFENFVYTEKNRLPLFIGSQFGVFPKLEEIYNGNEEVIKIAILSKSLLSGTVSGLKIYLYSNGDLKELAYFES